MRLQEIMSTQVVTIGPDASARSAWTLMEREGIRHLPVMEDGRLVGVISERDLGGPKGGALRRGRKVHELMSAQTASAKPGTTLRQAANIMRGRLVGSLPVLEDGRLVGIVTATDVLEELGRGSTRPSARAQRQSMRMPPASARRAAARQVRTAKRSAKRAKRSRTSAAKSGAPDGEPAEITGQLSSTLGRHRRRRPDSPARAPLAKRLPRAQKRVAGRTEAPQTPAYIRSTGSVLDAADRDYLRRKLGRKLGKFAESIERTSVRVDDVNGPRGGTDKRCQIKVVLSGLPSVVVEEQHESVQAAMDRALARTERAVRRTLQRRRDQAIQPPRTAGSMPAYG